MQNLLPDKRLCYLPRAEHQHISEGLSFEELHHHSPLDVEVAGEEHSANIKVPPVSRLIPL